MLMASSFARERLYQPEIDRQRENVRLARLNLAEQERRLRELIEGFASGSGEELIQPVQRVRDFRP
jgi:hypothetical protein